MRYLSRIPSCTSTVGTAPQVSLAHPMNPDHHCGAGFFRVEAR
jgi:hypothetical protein